MERALDGLAASPGRAAGSARVLAPAEPLDVGPVPRAAREGQAAQARGALDAAAVEITAIATALRESGHSDEAEIVETGAMIAQDPVLHRQIAAAVYDRGLPAAAAILDCTEAQARVIAQLDDAGLAERADDIRSVGRRAVSLIGSGPVAGQVGERNGAGQILVAPDLGPAEVAELESGVAGIALAAGGVSAHAAIVARSLGIPMVVGAGDGLLGASPGDTLVVDGSDGAVYLSPDPSRVEAVRHEADLTAIRRSRAIAERGLPAITSDGHPVRVLANVAGIAELVVALEAGAEGVGLLRTELVFLAASEWPGEPEHRRALAPVLDRLDGRTATVRVLDFGGDKTPPFLGGVEERGIELLLKHPDALAAQLRAIVACAGGSELRVLLPMVNSVEQIDQARRAILDAVDAVPGAGAPLIGAMIETEEGVSAVGPIAAQVDFLSIGTNDLTHSVLRADRFSPQVARAHNPRVLRAIAAVAEAAAHAGVPLEVCGEAASDPITAPLLIGAGVDELSVGAARVGTVRGWVRALSFAETSTLEAEARRLKTPAQVEAGVASVARRLALLEQADAGGEALDGPVGVGTAGAESQPRPALGA
jgi:phosphoenolpyruvate-protein kinase (PTS system EI component)